MVKIKFNNPNSRTLTSIEIYREDLETDIPDPTVNPPLTVLDGFETSYTDMTTELGKDYKYYFNALRQGASSVLTGPVILGDVSLYGPGEFSAAVSATTSMWSFGTLSDLELLPSATDLAAYAGDGATFLNWSGQWSKFKVGSDIYFSLYRGYIKIPTENFEAFMNAVATAGQFRKGYMTYEFAKLPVVTTMEVLDGLMPVTWNFVKESPRKSILDAATGLPYSAQASCRVVTAVNNETNGTAFKPNTSSEFLASSSDPVYMPTHQQYEWYWKPIIKFIPQSVRNFG